MKKISEVCKMAGVTRKTLRGYADVGLLVPTTRSDDGNQSWLYDDEALKKLRFIQIFVEAGYPRSRIREILESPDTNLTEEYDRLICSLKEKQKRIEGFIRTVELIKLLPEYPSHTGRALYEMDTEQMYMDGSSAEFLEESFASSAELDAADFEEAKLFVPLFFRMIAIGSLKDNDPASEKVSNCVKELCDSFLFMVCADGDENDGAEIPEATATELAAYTYAWADAVLSEPADAQMIDRATGPGGADFVKEALAVFGKNHCLPGESFEAYLDEAKSDLSES